MLAASCSPGTTRRLYPGPGLVDLPRRVGMEKAREISLTGNFVDAETAVRIGLADHVVPHSELLSLALDLAGAIAAQPPSMVRTIGLDWDENGTLFIRDAHRRHVEIFRIRPSRESARETLRANMSGVISRAHRRAP